LSQIHFTPQITKTMNYLKMGCFLQLITTGQQVTTTSLRVKEVGVSPGGLLYEFPLFRVSYCGTDKTHPEALSVVAKDGDGE